MASFILALSFFILVLFNGYFTLPIVDEQRTNSTFSLLNDHLTTEQAFNLRLVPDNETSVLPDVDKKGLTGEHLGFEVSTSFFNAPEEKVGQAIRAFDELSSTEPTTFTTESSLPDLSFTTVEATTYTTESSLPDLSFTTVEPTTYTSESSLADKRSYHRSSSTTTEPTEPLPELEIRSYHRSSSTTTEPTEPLPELEIRSFTNESENETESETDKRGHHHFSFTTSEPIDSVPQLEIRSFTNESENETDSETDKRGIQVDFTTDTLSFTSTASSIAPKLYTSQSSTSTSTEKYTGLLKYKTVDQDEQEPEQSTRLTKTFKKVLTTKPTNFQPEEEELEQSTKLTKTFKKVLTTKSTNIQPEDQSVEDPKEPTAPTAVFDQEALKKISYLPNDFMVLDENNTFVVTDLPDKYSTSTMKNKREPQPLTQGEEPLQSEKKESRH